MISTIEICVNDDERSLMQLYMDGLYEKEIKLHPGENSYTIYKDQNIVKRNVVNVANECSIYVRYLPYGFKYYADINDENLGIFDSVNNSNKFTFNATLVGDIGSFSHKYLNENIQDWNPFNKNAKLSYMGGGIFYKKFKFSDVLMSEYVIRYKVVLNEDWNNSIGLSDGSNIVMELPAGSSDFIICVDSIRMRVLDSAKLPTVCLKLSESTFCDIRTFYTNISLLGNFNNWNSHDISYKFMQITRDLYVLYKYFEPGGYTYTCSFNDIVRDNKKKLNRFLIKKRTAVIFVYDASDCGTLIDSINSPQKVISLLGFRNAMQAKAIDEFAYYGNDLGARYKKEKTVFKLWSPKASKVKLKRYTTGSDDEPQSRFIGIQNMELNHDNVWTTVVNGDIKDTYYNYLVTVDDNTFETVDIYAKATGVNGNRSMVVDLRSTDPEGFAKDKRIRIEKPTDAVLWELHVKDFSFFESSGVSKENRGKYLAFTEKNTRLSSDNNFKTCVAYLKELGITHVHLLPVFDYATIDEAQNDEQAFNWGYDPKNYNVPEGSYSSDPYHGSVRINEFKQMVKSLHEEGIGVVMDVVYNHTYYSYSSCFNLSVPDYYYRLISGGLANASGCGCETASERLMFRKYMIDSLLYWVNEYHIDGFRFDLMAIHDIDTMNQIREELNKLENGNEILLYGEPWSALGTAQEPGINMCIKQHVKMLDNNIAVFNDSLRDSVPGKIMHCVEYMGFIQGVSGQEQNIKNGIMAQKLGLGFDEYTYFAKCPSQVVNYVSAHDNLSLYDKLVLSTKGGEGYEFRHNDVIRMNKISSAIVILSLGIPFWQAGEEFARTKFGNDNSYNAPAHVNALDWNRVKEYSDLVEFYKGLIKIRKHFSCFRDPSPEAYRNICFTQNSQANVVAYTIKDKNDSHPVIGVVYNSNPYPISVELFVNEGERIPNSWSVIADINKAGTEVLGEIEGNKINIGEISLLVIVGK